MRTGLLIVMLAACTPNTAPTRAPAPAVRPEPSAPAARADEPAPVDLVRALGLDLAVSSSIHNFTDVAWHLADDDPATAWNSRTGDLAGAWIEARVPDGARVTSIRMTAGYTKTTAAGRDLFALNHRVARVRVTRDGAPVGEFALDPEAREPQTLPVQGGAGVYRVELVALVPGARRDWREACVSSFEVMGVAPCGASERPPVVHLGSLAGPDSARVFEARVAVRDARERRLHADDRDPAVACPGPYEPDYFADRAAEADAVAALARLACDPTPALTRALAAYDRASRVEADLRPDYLVTVYPMYLGGPDERRAAFARGITGAQMREALSTRDAAVRALAAACAPPIDQMRFPPDANDEVIEQLEPTEWNDDEAAGE